MRGFTLVEVLVAAGILGFLILAILGILIIGDRVYNDDVGLLDLQQQLRLVMDGMTRELRQNDSSQNITISNGGAMISFYIARTSGPVSFYLSNNRIIREHPAGTTSIVANNINDLSFCWVHDGLPCDISRNCAGECSNSNFLQLELAANKTIINRQVSFSLSSKAKLRNE